MTYNTKNLAIVLAFASVLLVWPVSQSAYGAGSAASVDPNCPVDFPASVAFGTFQQNVVDTEIVMADMSTGGTKAGNLRIDAQDWIGDGLPADGSVTFVGVSVGDTVTIDSIVYTGVSGNSADNITFEADAGDAEAATELAASITAGDPTFTATAVLNSVLLVTAADGDTSEPLVTSNPVNIHLSGATVTGGEATDQPHMAAEHTRYLVTSNGTAVDTGIDYLLKHQLNTDAAGDKVVVGTTDIAQPVKFIFQISGVGTLTDLPYSGPLSQVLTVDVTCVA